MRMRKLGHGQSVMFFAPTEIDRQIRKAGGLSDADPVDTLHIIHWAIIETSKDLRHHISHWVQQGVDHKRRTEAEQRYIETKDVAILKEGWKTLESRPLEEMYGISDSQMLSSGSFAALARSIPTLRSRLDLLGVQKLGDPRMDEEQEREAYREVERERQVERPPKRKPAPHSMHPGLETFVRTGSIQRNLPGIISLFVPLEGFESYDPSAWSESLFATADFCSTIANSLCTNLDHYMRPINWILSSHSGDFVALSPYEVNALLPQIRDSKVVRLHVYTPRLTQSMKSFSDLGFYTVPTLPTLNWSPPSPIIQMQLNLWAGQLYLQDYTEYRWLCAFLGICLDTGIHARNGIPVQSDGFVMPADRQVLARRYPEYAICQFTSSPINMLKELISYRRKGMSYVRTHLGQILHARRLGPNDF